MGLWRDKETGNWKYSFEYKRRKFGGGGFSTRAEAVRARENRRLEVRAGLSRDLKKESCLNEYLLNAPEVNTKFDALKLKYHALYKDPENNIGLIFDLIMEDFDIPVRFKDIRKLATKANYRKNIPIALRMKILKRDNFRCRLCGTEATESKIQVDHIVPVSLGGVTDERNLQALCEECNLGKLDNPKIGGGLVAV